MYKSSYEKCVCFLFLVMVVFLSCSGFRIDELPMTDVSSKKYSHTSSSSFNFLNRLMRNYNPSNAPEVLAKTETTTTVDRAISRKFGPHHIRHPRRVRHPRRTRHHADAAQASRYQNSRDKIYSKARPTSGTDERYAQISPSDIRTVRPTAPSRASKAPKGKQQRNKLFCQEQDIARKAFRANTVVLAKAESMSSNRVHNYSVSFRIIKRYEPTRYRVDDNLRLTFLNDTKRMNCESELDKNHGLVKAQIQQSRSYFLFLNYHGSHNYSVFGTPVLKRRRKDRVEDIILKVRDRHFEPKLREPLLNVTQNYPLPNSNVTLICRARGYPIPVITWKRNDTVLRNSNKFKIKYSNKRRNSTLVIRKVQESDAGHYSCIATGVDGNQLSAQIHIRIGSQGPDLPCEKDLETNYCFNGGTCRVAAYIHDLFCICPEGYHGQKCEEKQVSANVTINQTTESYLVMDEYPTKRSH